MKYQQWIAANLTNYGLKPGTVIENKSLRAEESQNKRKIR